MEDLIAETERNTDKLTEEIIGCETSEKQQTTLNSCVNSVSVETNINQIEYFIKNNEAQTHAIVPSKSTKSVGTQTFITSDYLSKKLFPKLVSSSSQTSPIPDDCEMNTVDEIDKPTSHSCRNEDDTHSSMIVHKGNSQLTMDPMGLILQMILIMEKVLVMSFLPHPTKEVRKENQKYQILMKKESVMKG